VVAGSVSRTPPRALDALQEAADEAKRVPMDSAARNAFAGLLRESFKRVTGQPLGVRESRDMVRYEDPERRTMPAWLKAGCS
jgi:hypothetical protein